MTRENTETHPFVYEGLKKQETATAMNLDDVYEGYSKSIQPSKKK